MKLSEKQLAHFRGEGYVVVRHALSCADLNPVILEIEEFVSQKARDLQARGEISRSWQEETFHRRLAAISRESTAIYDQMDIMHFRGRRLFESLGNEILMDLVEGLIGPEITCSPIQHLRPKLPGQLRALDFAKDDSLSAKISEHVAPWHQDAQVHLEDADPEFILTVWVPLCDTDEDNGCLEIVPGVHKSGMVYWGEGFGMSEDSIPGEEVVALPMKAGDVLLMHKLIPHRSTPNRSDGIRWSLDLRYQKSGTPTGRNFYPDFIARSQSQAPIPSMSYDSWCQAWISAIEKVPTDKRPGRAERPTAPVPVVVQDV